MKRPFATARLHSYGSIAVARAQQVVANAKCNSKREYVFSNRQRTGCCTAIGICNRYDVFAGRKIRDFRLGRFIIPQIGIWWRASRGLGSCRAICCARAGGRQGRKQNTDFFGLLESKFCRCRRARHISYRDGYFAGSCTLEEFVLLLARTPVKRVRAFSSRWNCPECGTRGAGTGNGDLLGNCYLQGQDIFGHGDCCSRGAAIGIGDSDHIFSGSQTGGLSPGYSTRLGIRVRRIAPGRRSSNHSVGRIR